MPERVVLAQKTSGFVPFQWTGNEPAGLDDIDVATSLGAEWEGDELVTYELESFSHAYSTHDQEFMEDND